MPKELVHKICIEICDGCGGRCQRYPNLSESCNEFAKLERAFRAGISFVQEALRSETPDASWEFEKSLDGVLNKQHKG